MTPAARLRNSGLDSNSVMVALFIRVRVSVFAAPDEILTENRRLGKGGPLPIGCSLHLGYLDLEDQRGIRRDIGGRTRRPRRRAPAG